jgi:hypothetical protein
MYASMVVLYCCPKPKLPLVCRLCLLQVLAERVLVKNVEIGAATLSLDQVRLYIQVTFRPHSAAI